MTSTYDPELSTVKDHVRFLIGDTIDGKFQLTNEEILATIADVNDEYGSGNVRFTRYYSAFVCLSSLRTRWLGSGGGKGLLRKQVSKLNLEWGSDRDTSSALDNRISWLRQRAMWYLTPRPKLVEGYR